MKKKHTRNIGNIFVQVYFWPIPKMSSINCVILLNGWSTPILSTSDSSAFRVLLLRFLTLSSSKSRVHHLMASVISWNQRKFGGDIFKEFLVLFVRMADLHFSISSSHTADSWVKNYFTFCKIFLKLTDLNIFKALIWSRPTYRRGYSK